MTDLANQHTHLPRVLVLCFWKLHLTVLLQCWCMGISWRWWSVWCCSLWYLILRYCSSTCIMVSVRSTVYWCLYCTVYILSLVPLVLNVFVFQVLQSLDVNFANVTVLYGNFCFLLYCFQSGLVWIVSNCSLSSKYSVFSNCPNYHAWHMTQLGLLFSLVSFLGFVTQNSFCNM